MQCRGQRWVNSAIKARGECTINNLRYAFRQAVRGSWLLPAESESDRLRNRDPVVETQSPERSWLPHRVLKSGVRFPANEAHPRGTTASSPDHREEPTDIPQLGAGDSCLLSATEITPDIWMHRLAASPAARKHSRSHRAAPTVCCICAAMPIRLAPVPHEFGHFRLPR